MPLTNSDKSSAQGTRTAVHAMDCIGRTQGDGMENVSATKTESKQTKCRLGDSYIYHPTNLKSLDSTSPVTPTGTIVNLVPKSITSTKEHRHVPHSLKSKEPKFVPYEPYKAAVNPIIPFTKKGKQTHRSDINVGDIFQFDKIKISETELMKTDNSKENDTKLSNTDWNSEKEMYKARIQKLEDENNQLQNQLKFQVQVNGELKNLLVAAVGEDLETKVHLLTEDKLQLAQALLNSAQHLSTHQEQTEWLAGQCEVWRSKFLASSLMVEDLAKWKAALCQRTVDLQEAITRLLEERSKIQDVSFKTYRFLRILRENFDPAGYKNHSLSSLNVVDLAHGCYQLAEVLNVQLLSGIYMNLQRELNTTNLETKTIAEKTAEKLLTCPNTLLSRRQDDACSAVMGAAVAIGGQMFFVQKDTNVACCSHCSGEVKQV